MSENIRSPYLKLPECADYLRVSISTVRQWMSKEENPLPSIRVREKGKILFDIDEVNEWMKGNIDA